MLVDPVRDKELEAFLVAQAQGGTDVR